MRPASRAYLLGDFEMSRNWLSATRSFSPFLAPSRSNHRNWAASRLKLFACLLLLSLAHPVQAQVTASIKGIVTDASGAAVPSAAVRVKNLETGAIRNTSTDDAGRYLVLALPVGEYEVRVSKQNFQDSTHTGIHLVVGQEATVNVP